MESPSPNPAKGAVDLSALVGSATVPTPPPPTDPASPPSAVPTLVTPEVLASELGEVVKPSEPPRPRRRWLRLALWAGLAVLLTGVSLTAAAELGWLNSGIDRLYGRTKLSFLWGSLPADFTTAATIALERPGAMAISTRDSENRLKLQFEVKPSDNLSLPQIGWLRRVYASTPRLAQADSPTVTTQTADQPADLPTSITGDLQLTTTFLSELSKLQLDLTLNSSANGTNFALTSSAVVIDNELYVQIPSTPALTDATSLPSDLLGKYVHTTLPASFRDELGKIIADSQTKTGYEILGESYEVERDEVDYVIKALGQRVKRVGIERRDGRLSSHWRLELDGPGLQQLIKEISGSDDAVTYTEQVSTMQLQWDFWVGHRNYELIGSHLTITTSTAFGQGQLQAQSDTTEQPTVKTISSPPANRIIEWADFQRASGLTAPSSNSTDSDLDFTAATAPERDEARRERIDTLASLIETAHTLGKSLPDSAEAARLNDAAHPAVKQLRSLAAEYGADDTQIDSYLLDPLPDRYYFGYRKQGNVVTLTAVLEDKAASDCRRQTTAAGELCIFEKQINL